MSFPANATLAPTPFKISVPQADIDGFKTLLKLSRLPPKTYEGTDSKFGVTSKWVAETKKYWEESFDWRKHEEAINKFPQFTAPVQGKDGETYSIHFIAILSPNPDAIPLILMHGWPGSFLEFIDIIPLLAASASPSFHIIVPSLPGYAFSSPPPLDKNFSTVDAAYLMNNLMVGLGLGGYIAQGGDIGSILARTMQNEYSECRAFHVNAYFGSGSHSPDTLDSTDLAGLERAGLWRKDGNAYAIMHATRPSTIAHVLSSSPLALMAWIGEKLLAWSDEDPPIEKILQMVSLYWFTETFPRAIYPYRELFSPDSGILGKPILKPMGYSLFPYELIPYPGSWVEAEAGGNLIWFKRNEKGGHFAALEQPELLTGDIVQFGKTLVNGEGAAKAVL